MLRRSLLPVTTEPGGMPESDALAFGPVTIDLCGDSALRGGEPVELPAKGFEVLRTLAQQAGQVVDRAALIEKVWGKEGYLNERTLTNLVVRIRQIIEPDPSQPRYLKTVHGVGYKLDV